LHTPGRVVSRMMRSQGKVKHASRRTSWRLGKGSTGGTLLLIVTLLGVGGMYLAVSAKVADVGREVLTLEKRREDLLQTNSDLTAKLAQMTTPERMLARASEMGFRPAGPNDVEFVPVEGFQENPPFLAPRPPASSEIGSTMLSPAYTETLGEWFTRVLGDGGSE
jgi:cell division protein FtsL